jgi:hypothetical protein
VFGGEMCDELEFRHSAAETQRLAPAAEISVSKDLLPAGQLIAEFYPETHCHARQFSKRGCRLGFLGRQSRIVDRFWRSLVAMSRLR